MSENEISLVLRAIDSVKSELSTKIEAVHAIVTRVEVQANKTNGNVLDLQRWRALVQKQINSVSKLLSFIDHTAIPNGIRVIIGTILLVSALLAGWKVVDGVTFVLKIVHL